MKRAGYAFRQKYSVFLYRYKMLCEDTWPHYRGKLCDYTSWPHYRGNQTAIHSISMLQHYAQRTRMFSGIFRTVMANKCIYAKMDKLVWMFRQRHVTCRVLTGAAKDGVQALLDYLCVSQEEYAFGLSKIFIANPQTVSNLSKLI